MAGQPEQMMDFVLVHGGWHGGWAWRKVADRLVGQGHRVFTPTLTGLADRSHLATPAVNLSTHVQDILGILHWERLDSVVLCGHSYAGYVITMVADQVPEKIHSLVYADSIVARDGDSLMGELTGELRDAIRELARSHGNGWMVPPIDPAAWRIARPEDVALVKEMMTPHPLACFEEAVRLRHADSPVARRVFIRATGFPEPAIERSQARLDATRWVMRRVDCGHELMLDRPDEVAGILLDEANRA
jgi:pimeloyl-ACP methyl ester carboxylesterase